MPNASQCPARAKRLIRAVVKFQTWHEKLAQHCRAQQPQEGTGKSLKSILRHLRSRRDGSEVESFGHRERLQRYRRQNFIYR